MTEHWIWLAGCKGLGPVKQRQLLEQFGSAEALWAADDARLRRAGLSPALLAALADRSLAQAGATLQRCSETGVRVLTLRDPDYPPALSAIADAPIVLYLRGTLPDLANRPGIALVGARDADRRGLDTARMLGWQISGCGGVVITGLARGIDTAAAWGALEQGGAVIGVLGCGPDVVYPRENAALYARVPDRGCLISEYPPGTQPNSRFFPARNRIISALSDGVTVVQATGRSGALITARWAADQGRDVFAVPGPAGEPLSAGCNRLLKEGAILAECGWDVVSEYEYRYPENVQEYHGRPPAAGRTSGPSGAACAGPAASLPSGKGRSAPGVSAKPPLKPAAPAGLTPIQQTVAAALADGPLQLDALISKTDLPPAQLLPQLTLLQMKRVIICLPGKIYQLA